MIGWKVKESTAEFWEYSLYDYECRMAMNKIIDKHHQARRRLLAKISARQRRVKQLRGAGYVQCHECKDIVQKSNYAYPIKKCTNCFRSYVRSLLNP